MSLLNWIAKNTIINWNRPVYSDTLFKLSSRYVDFWYGDNNFDRKTNGEFWLLTKLMPRCKTVFDVGGHIGAYSGEILKINPKIEIHAFEPDPVSYEKLSKLPLKATNIALGEKVGTGTLYQAERSSHNSLYDFNVGQTKIEIPISTLDIYCKDKNIQHIDFLKIDVEGYEYNVLEGAQSMLSEGNIDYIQFEFSGATAESRRYLKDFIAFLDGYGFDLFRIRAKDVQLVEWYPDRERYTLTNYLAVKRGNWIPK